MASGLRLYAAGSNAQGQLGSNHTDDQHTLFPAIFNDVETLPDGVHILGFASGANHTLVLLQCAGLGAEVWGCGDSARGQLLSVGSTLVFRLFPLAVPERPDLVPAAVAASWETSFVIFTPRDPASVLSDVVLSFGANDFGDRGASVAGTDTTSVMDFGQVRAPEFGIISQPALLRVRELVTGPHHVVARLDVWATLDSQPVCVITGWGAGRHGQLGSLPSVLAPSKTLVTPKPTSLKPKGSTRRDPRTANPQPSTITAHPPNADHPCQLAAGSQHTLILHSSSHIVGLGSERRGQLGIPAYTPASTSGSKSPSMNSPSYEPKRIGCSWTTSFVVSGDSSDDGRLSNWRIDACGSSNHGQLGRGSPPSNPTPSQTPQTELEPESKTGFGPVLFPQNITSETPFRKMACGSEHVLILAGEEVWGWGWNEHGNLGVGHTEDVLSPVCIWPRKQSDKEKEEAEGGCSGTSGRKGRVLDIWAGCGTSWILVEENDEK
ncbi:RCC1/BLIP-II [Ceratobasidium sp. AG-I]|nr:RCC1/BLIP-II [Ceratobasidium sp. AG-I]